MFTLSQKTIETQLSGFTKFKLSPPPFLVCFKCRDVTTTHTGGNRV